MASLRKAMGSWLALLVVGAAAPAVPAQDLPVDGQEGAPHGAEADDDSGGAAAVGFGGRTGGHRNLRALGGGGTEEATENGLEWLRRRQDPGGHWGGSPEGTGLALLAFLGYGETHKTPRYGATVRAGLKYLKAIQDPDGCFGPRGAPGFPRGHAVAAVAMA